jgi:hypothetical protein
MEAKIRNIKLGTLYDSREGNRSNDLSLDTVAPNVAELRQFEIK